MDFAFTEEQQMLLDTVRRFVTGRYGLEYRKRVRDSDEGWSRDIWKGMADLGLLAVNIPERDGGLGAGPVGSMLAGTAMGECLSLEPFLSSAVVATQVIVELGSAEQRTRWLPRMAAGELVAVLAHDEVSNRSGVAAPAFTRAVREAGHWRLSGHKAMVYHAPAAGLLLVSARTEDGSLGLFAVPADASGLQLHACITVDDQRAAEVALERVEVAADARLGADAAAALHNALDAGLAALCAEAFGAMDRIFAATVEYSHSRKQFGVPIGSFQALQHRMADMLMHLEQARSMLYLATSTCADANLQVRSAALDAAKALMGQAARYIGQQAIQLHGGMGMTAELGIGHYFKRLLAFELRGGTTAQHLDAYRIQMQAG